MHIAVSGSIATDHLMTFPGRFSDQLVADQLHTVSLSFLVDKLDVRRGGVGPNICFGMGQLGARPILVGAAGADFGEYRDWLDRHGVDTGSVRISEVLHTARFVVTTDADHNQIGSFYTGAMSEARLIELKTVADRVGGLDLVSIGADDPEAMLRHTEECRTRGIPFAADFSQQIARMEGDGIRTLTEGAAFLFSNEYEKGLIETKTGWGDEEMLTHVATRVTTLGARGVRIDRAGEEPILVGCPEEERKADPTGVGDAFRAGLPVRAELGREHGAGGAARLHAGDAGHRDRGPAGVRAAAQQLRRPLHQGVRAGCRRRGAGAPAGVGAGLT